MLTRLVILWLLSERPHHGYRIKKILQERALQFWFPLHDASIYSMLNSLVKEGYARKLVPEQEGNRPMRTLFEITPEGRLHYRDLLRDAWRDPTSYADPIQVALAARGDLKENEVRELAVERLAALEARLTELKQQGQSAPSADMVQRERFRLEAEIRWLKKWRNDHDR